MNTKQAKQLDFPRLLEKMGYHPVPSGVRKGGSEIWYHSPLNHSDKTPSFHVSKGKHIAWVFKCFSTGAEGNILDFVIAHEGGSVKTALSFLRGKFPGALFDYQEHRAEQTTLQPSFSFHQPIDQSQDLANQTGDRDLEFIQDLPLRSGTLLNYLEQRRKIPPALAQCYLRLVRYKNLKNGKTYYAIGMKNRAGGFEIRAASDTYSFKSALIARDISIIEGRGKSEGVLVFEGMTDFLSYLAMIGEGYPSHDAIIMHSVNSYNRCKDYILQRGYRHVFTFLDNDKTGVKYTTRFLADFGKMVTSLSEQFQPHKDLNDALKNGAEESFCFLPRREGRGLDLS